MQLRLEVLLEKLEGHVGSPYTLRAIRARRCAGADRQRGGQEAAGGTGAESGRPRRPGGEERPRTPRQETTGDPVNRICQSPMLTNRPSWAGRRCDRKARPRGHSPTSGFSAPSKLLTPTVPGASTTASTSTSSSPDWPSITGSS